MNWLKGIFVHKVNDSEHPAIIRYHGITTIGYICANCGYKWYVKRIQP